MKKTVPLSLIALAFFLSVGLLPPHGGPMASERQVPQSREEVMLSFAPVVREVAPAVVNIYTKKIVEQRAVSPLFNDPFFKRFFGERFAPLGKPRKREQNALGSGVIVEDSGLVVTNFHVIKGADEIRVVLNDRREFDAELILDDEDTDLAILQLRDVAGEELPIARFRDSDEVEVGDIVLAIGNPFGVGQTVTSGIVSALARTQVGVSDYNFFIQTDAAINPGNSGGALVTLDGRLVGINTAIYSRSGGSIGIGFAIPSSMVRAVVDAAQYGGAITRPWVGVTGQDVTSDLAQGFGLERPGGVVINEIYPGSPADEAGLEVGDIILRIDGKRVDDSQSLRFRVATKMVGGAANLEVFRKGDRLQMSLPLRRAPEDPPRDQTLLEGRHPAEGAVVANLSPALAEELDLQGQWQGVIILKIRRGSLAQRFGLKPGDMILKWNGETIENVDDLQRASAKQAEKWDITLNRGGKVRSFTIES